MARAVTGIGTQLAEGASQILGAETRVLRR
jgi:hypothetical protein